MSSFPSSPLVLHIISKASLKNCVCFSSKLCCGKYVVKSSHNNSVLSCLPFANTTHTPFGKRFIVLCNAAVSSNRNTLNRESFSLSSTFNIWCPLLHSQFAIDNERTMYIFVLLFVIIHSSVSLCNGQRNSNTAHLYTYFSTSLLLMVSFSLLSCSLKS